MRRSLIATLTVSLAIAASFGGGCLGPGEGSSQGASFPFAADAADAAESLL